MYDPSIGRWLEEDPIGFGGSDTNLYRYVGNNPTDEVDPSGLLAGAGEVQYTAISISGLIASEKEIGGEEREKGAIKTIESRFGVKIGDVNDQKSLVRVKKTEEGIRADFIDFVKFSAKLNGADGSIIQDVETTNTGITKSGEKETNKSHFVEGWVVDNKGNQKGLDTHSFGFLLDNDSKSLTTEITFTVGVGLFDTGCGFQKITGQRSGDGGIKGVFDIFPNGASDKIKWLGPKKTYKVTYYIDSDGHWKFVDQSTGLSREGTFDKETKK